MYKYTDGGVIRLSDKAFIPENLSNKDWRRYLDWVHEGNETEDQYSLEEQKEQLIKMLRHRFKMKVKELRIGAFGGNNNSSELFVKYLLDNFEELKDEDNQIYFGIDYKKFVTKVELQTLINNYHAKYKILSQKYKFLMNSLETKDKNFLDDLNKLFG